MFNIHKAELDGVRNYANEQIRSAGSMVCRVILQMSRADSDLFRNEVSTHANSLKDPQWGIFSGVGNMAQAVGYKLTENEERNSKQDCVMHAMCDGVQNLLQAIGGCEETQIGLVAMGRKLNGRWEVLEMQY